MLFSIPLAALLALSATTQGPDAGKPAAIAPLIGEEVAAVVRIDLTRLDVDNLARKIFAKPEESAELALMIRPARSWSRTLATAGATELYVLVDLGDMPGLPVVVVPIAADSDPKLIAGILTGSMTNPPVRWPAAETIRGCVVAGSSEALTRIREARPGSRPELIEALSSGGDAPIIAAIAPSLIQRRTIDESLPNLPAELGGGSSRLLTRGLAWCSIRVATAPEALIKLTMKGIDPTATEALGKIATTGLASLVTASRSDPSTASLAPTLEKFKPSVTGDRITLEANLSDTAALVSVPVEKFRDEARRSECVNHLKQFGLAMHNYHATHKAFPPAYVAAKDGKPLLSWRVLILPFVEEEGLFTQFHLDEPWDSPHNKTLISRMPKVFACPSANPQLAAEGKTTYLVPRGPNTMFTGAEGTKIQQITDGTSNTVMAIDANDRAAVIWTKPDDGEPSPEWLFQNFIGHHSRGPIVLLADGSVKTLQPTIKLAILRALISKAGGERLTNEDF